MRIAHIILPGASEYERKSQRADRAALAERHEVVVVDVTDARSSGADLAHVYATGELPAAAFIGFEVPYVASASVRKSRWPWRKAVAPRVVVTPDNLPEVVEDPYFAAPRPSPSPGVRQGATVGFLARRATGNMVEQIRHRIERFRDDVTWTVFDAPPPPEDLAAVDVWIDPAVDESDFDGFVAEALVVGVPVVAARTAINARRLEQGRTGMLVPPRDPNEMTHAILAALFKPEVANSKISAARQTVSKFRARHRLRALMQMYDGFTR